MLAGENIENFVNIFLIKNFHPNIYKAKFAWCHHIRIAYQNFLDTNLSLFTPSKIVLYSSLIWCIVGSWDIKE